MAESLQDAILIVGGGPSGLAAATALRRLGVPRVIVLEREPMAGGIPRHCGHYPFGLREYGRMMKGPDYARHLVRTAQEAGVEIRTQVTVTDLAPGPAVSVTGPSGPQVLAPRLVLLATGARETSRAARLLGGTKPGGVITTGTLQSMVYLHGQLPFRQPVILGTELVSFSAILTCRHLGIRPTAMIEPNGRTTARWPTALFPRLARVPLLLGTEITAIHGRDRVTSVSVRDTRGSRDIACDGVIVSGGFRPDAAVLQRSHLRIDPASGGPEIDQYGRCSDPDYFAAGNLLRAVETAGWSWREGWRMAQIMADALHRPLPDPSADTITLNGDALAYCVPQRLARSDGQSPLRGFQLRVNRAVKGTLVMRVDGQITTRKPVETLPERRILLPYPDTRNAGKIDITLDETA